MLVVGVHSYLRQVDACVNEEQRESGFEYWQYFFVEEAVSLSGLGDGADDALTVSLRRQIIDRDIVGDLRKVLSCLVGVISDCSFQRREVLAVSR